MPIDLNEGSGFIYGRVPPVRGIITDTGVGKTRLWREAVALPLIKQGLRPAIAIPLHQLGDEIVADLAADGIVAFVYRGRDADDPNAPGHKMCREQERVGLITQALGSVSPHACKRGDKKCRFFDDCSYLRQQHQRPEMWVFAHQLLFHQRPDFIAHPDALAIDESFWQAGLRGNDRPDNLWLCSLKDDRRVPRDDAATADLVATSDRVHAMLLRENAGFIRRAALIDAGITRDELGRARSLEWRRKKDLKELDPGMPLNRVYEICEPVMAHNQDVRRLATFFDLLMHTLEGDAERSPYLNFQPEEPTGLTGSNKQPAVRMIWRADIHPSWHAPTTVMDATMQPDIVRQYLPRMAEPIRVSAPTPHIYVRQLMDRSMSSLMLIPKETRREKYNQTAQNNDERVRDYIEVHANDVRPSRVLVICQLGLEIELNRLGVPDNVDVQHFGNIVGKNTWNEVALLIVIGRTDPGPQEIEKLARALFGVDIAASAVGQWYPSIERGARMRDGRIAALESPCHPDPRAEAVRWSICEAQLMQAIGRGRAVNRTADNPLKIDILTNYALPIVVDEFTTWQLIQPTSAEIMRARGVVPLNYRDMAATYPDLFLTGEAARKALERENPGQTPIEKYIIGVCPGFCALGYCRVGSRGPASKLLFDRKRIDPVAWLTERIGEIKVMGGTPISFKEYLNRRRRTDTPEGDFVEAAKRDRNPPEATTWEELDMYLWHRRVPPEAIAAGRTVWQQYLRYCAKHRS